MVKPFELHKITTRTPRDRRWLATINKIFADTRPDRDLAFAVRLKLQQAGLQTEGDARDLLQLLLDHHAERALDPKVSTKANALIKRGETTAYNVAISSLAQAQARFADAFPRFEDAISTMFLAIEALIKRHRDRV
jgi:hypothetical protein